MFAAHHKLDRLIAFVDANKRQLDGYTKDINDLGDIAAKFASFGWDAHDVDGANVMDIQDAIRKAKTVEGRPKVIVLDTVKGQGVPFIEQIELNHHIVLDKELAAKAIDDLEHQLESLHGSA